MSSHRREGRQPRDARESSNGIDSSRPAPQGTDTLLYSSRHLLRCIHQPTHPLTHPLTHSLTHQPLTHSLIHTLTHPPLSHSLTHSLTRPPTHSPTHCTCLAAYAALYLDGSTSCNTEYTTTRPDQPDPQDPQDPPPNQPDPPPDPPPDPQPDPPREPANKRASQRHHERRKIVTSNKQSIDLDSQWARG